MSREFLKIPEKNLQKKKKCHQEGSSKNGRNPNRSVKNLKRAIGNRKLKQNQTKQKAVNLLTTAVITVKESD